MSAAATIINTAAGDGMPGILPALLLAQARHETNDFLHRFFTSGNNAFGYSYVSGSKWQLPTGGDNADNGQKIARYASVADSVHEITDWIKRRQNAGIFPKDLATIKTPEQYAHLLKAANYYQASEADYAAGLRRKLGDTAGALGNDTGVGLLVAAVAIGLLVHYKLI